MQVEGRIISRVLLVDDSPEIRCFYGMSLDDLEAKTEEVESLPDLQNFVSSVSMSDGVVCDLNLNTGFYSKVNGDVIVSTLYGRKSPAVLCSRDAESVSSVRRLRHAIPCLIEAKNLNPDTVNSAFELCLKEFKGEYSFSRKPFPTLIRFENLIFQTDHFIKTAVVIPGWDSGSLVEVDIAPEDGAIYKAVKDAFAHGEIFRCKATVNLQVEVLKDLYVTGWKISNG